MCPQLQEFEEALKQRDEIITQLTANMQQARTEKEEVMREFLQLTEQSQKLQIQFQQVSDVPSVSLRDSLHGQKPHYNDCLEQPVTIFNCNDYYNDNYNYDYVTIGTITITNGNYTDNCYENYNNITKTIMITIVIIIKITT